MSKGKRHRTWTGSRVGRCLVLEALSTSPGLCGLLSGAEAWFD